MSSNLEEIYRIHHTAGYLEISEDPDGLGMLQLKWWEAHDKKFTDTITVPSEILDDLVTAISRLRERLQAK